MTNNQSNELEIILSSLDSNPAIKREAIEKIERLIQDRERQARIQTMNDVKKAGYGYDDGTGFVLKISYKELEQLKGDKS